MTSVNYDVIFSYFLGYVTDHQLASMSMQDAYDFMVEYLHKALAKPYTRRLFSSCDIDDNIQVITFEMEYVVDESADTDFVIDILSKGMVIEWLEPQVNSKNNVLQFFGGKEQKFYSQSTHLGEISALLESLRNEQKDIIRDRGYINNSYLGS